MTRARRNMKRAGAAIWIVLVTGVADMRRQLDDLMRSADELRRRIDARSNTE